MDSKPKYNIIFKSIWNLYCFKKIDELKIFILELFPLRENTICKVVQRHGYMYKHKEMYEEI